MAKEISIAEMVSKAINEIAAKTEGRLRPIGDVMKERNRQDEKWGEQHHPDGTGPGATLFGRTFSGMARDLKAINDERASHGVEWDTRAGRLVPSVPLWSLILLEEVYEALESDDPAHLREELVQVAAVAVNWIEDIDSREGADHE